METNNQLKQTLEALLKAVDTQTPLNNFVATFSKVLDTFVAMKKATAQEVAQIKAELAQLATDLQAKHDQSVSDIKAQVQSALEKHTAAIAARLATVQDGEDGEDGEDAVVDYDLLAQKAAALIPAPKEPDPIDEDKIIAAVLEQIPTPKSGKDGRTVGWGAHPLLIQHSGTTIDKVARTINFSTNLSVSRNTSGVITVSATGGTLTELAATGTINSSNTAFTFVSKPTYIFIDGLKYRENEGWSWTAGTLTATVTKAPDYSIWGES